MNYKKEAESMSILRTVGYYGELEVHALDESVQIRLAGDEKKPEAVYTMTVKEAEELIGYLKAGIEEAKKSKWYKED